LTWADESLSQKGFDGDLNPGRAHVGLFVEGKHECRMGNRLQELRDKTIVLAELLEQTSLLIACFWQQKYVQLSGRTTKYWSHWNH